MSEFKKDFFNNYNDSINQKELFNNSNFNGFACSIVGLKTKMREENDLIVKNKGIQQLTSVGEGSTMSSSMLLGFGSGRKS